MVKIDGILVKKMDGKIRTKRGKNGRSREEKMCQMGQHVRNLVKNGKIVYMRENEIEVKELGQTETKLNKSRLKIRIKCKIKNYGRKGEIRAKIRGEIVQELGKKGRNREKIKPKLGAKR